MDIAYTYDDIVLAPRIVSHIKSRKKLTDSGIVIDTSRKFFGARTSIPILPAPMPDVCNGQMAMELSKNNVIGLIHRFQTVDSQLNEYKFACKNGLQEYIGCAISVTGDYKERFCTLYRNGCRIFCLDTANGMNIMVKEAVEWIRNFVYSNNYMTYEKDGNQHYRCLKCDYSGLDQGNFKDAHRCTEAYPYIIAGNIATKEGYRYLADCGVDAVRCGIGQGSACTTRIETGVTVPMVTTIKECVSERLNMATERYRKKYPGVPMYTADLKKSLEELPKIIADGSIKIPADFCKALALGADMVMAGGIFAGTDEAPGEIITIDGMKFKRYRGAASFSVQLEFTGIEPKFSEGEEKFIPYVGAVKNILERYENGLRSSMSYFNSIDLDEYKNNVDFCYLN